jgi:polyhydroxyalkanoate synthesis repressor PhaR
VAERFSFPLGFPQAVGKTVPNDTIRIKRYPNRRFYASHTSKYVSLPEIEQMIRDGANVQIVDSASGEDITRVILIQMISEQHPDRIALFPTALLHSILRANDVMIGFLRDYFLNSLAYLDYLQWHGASTPLPQPMHWMQAWLEGLSPPASDAPAVPCGAESPARAEKPDVAERIAQLEQRIAELERQGGAKA